MAAPGHRGDVSPYELACGPLEKREREVKAEAGSEPADSSVFSIGRSESGPPARCMATLSSAATRGALPGSDPVFEGNREENPSTSTSGGGGDGSPSRERLEARSITTQRSFPDKQELARLQEGHRIWNLRPTVELPTFKSCSDFAGRVELYRGRHSIVWSCFCKQTKHPLVVKMYDKSKMNARHFKNAGREVAILKMLYSSEEKSFAGVVGFLGSFEDASNLYIVQAKCSKGDLFKELLRKGGTMEESRVCTEVVVPLLLTLQHLHNLHVVHRDIKPENIFFTAENELKLGDFGLAINTSKEKPISRVGTLDYMAPEVLAMPTPEQIAKKKINVNDIVGYGDKVDIWALGILVYELIAGRPPFEVEDPDQTALLIMHADLEQFPGHMGQQCISFIKQALRKEPKERLSAAALLQHPWVAQHYQVSLPLELHHSLLADKPTRGVVVPHGLQTTPIRDSAIGTSGSASHKRSRFNGSAKLRGTTLEAAQESVLAAAGVMANSGADLYHRLCTSAINGGAKKVSKRTSIDNNGSKRPQSAMEQSNKTMRAVHLESELRPRWRSCPGGSISCLARSSAGSEQRVPTPPTSGGSGSEEQKESCPLDPAVVRAWHERQQQTFGRPPPPDAYFDSPAQVSSTAYRPPAPASRLGTPSSPLNRPTTPSRFGGGASAAPQPSYSPAPQQSRFASSAAPTSRFAASAPTSRFAGGGPPTKNPSRMGGTPVTAVVVPPELMESDVDASVSPELHGSTMRVRQHFMGQNI